MSLELVHEGRAQKEQQGTGHSEETGLIPGTVRASMAYKAVCLRGEIFVR